MAIGYMTGEFEHGFLFSGNSHSYLVGHRMLGLKPMTSTYKAYNQCIKLHLPGLNMFSICKMILFKCTVEKQDKISLQGCKLWDWGRQDTYLVSPKPVRSCLSMQSQK